ncbi:MAG: SMP-30/gluconolactonase/LRE family protein, partial [Clostridia bacterium]
MKRGIAISLITVILLVMTGSSFTFAAPATSYTWAFNSKGRWTKTQDAYLPDNTFISLALKAPEELFIDKNDMLYIADTGNKRIVKFDVRTNKIVMVIQDSAINTPRGVFVTDDGNIYVADSKAGAIHRFDKDGKLIESFTRPSDVAFGKTPFNPAKIAVDTKKNMFIIGEGVLNGIIHLSNSGRFLGYFATNKVTLNLVEELQKIFFTEEQQKNLQSKVPLTMTNVFVDNENIVYSTTMGTEATEHIAKHNTAGQNVFNDPGGPIDLIDIYVDKNGIIYTATLRGTIGVYSPDGELVHIFGAFLGEEDISGLFRKLSAVAVDSMGRIWAVDSESAYLQSFVPTEYANLIYGALEALKLGQYSKAEELWHEVLSRNQMLRLGHEGLGKVYLYTQRYEEAMYHLEIANNKFFYSQAYWEVRNVWLQQNLAIIIVLLIAFFILMAILKGIDRRKNIFNPLRKAKDSIEGIRVIDDMLLMFSFLSHPVNSFYDLKTKARGSYLSATVWYVLFLGIFLHARFGRDFLFTPIAVEDIDFGALILGFLAIFILFVATNYLVTSIQDGEGSFGTIYKMTIYSMGPMILGTVIITIMSYFISYNEEFLIRLIEFIAPVWSLVILIVGLVEIQNYT